MSTKSTENGIGPNQIHPYSMEKPELYYFEAIKLTSKDSSNS